MEVIIIEKKIQIGYNMDLSPMMERVYCLYLPEKGFVWEQYSSMYEAKLAVERFNRYCKDIFIRGGLKK